MNTQDSITVYTLCYTMVFVAAWISSCNKSSRLFNAKGEAASNATDLLGLHVAGIFWLGLVPAPLFRQVALNILPLNGAPAFLWTCCFLIAFMLAVFTGMKAGRCVHIRYSSSSVLSDKFLVVYFTVRILYLAAYELFFRGVLLFGLAAEYGVITALIISTALTVLLHVFTNKKEMLGCIPFAIVLGCLCISSNAVWPAMVIHIALSLSYEIPPVKHFFTRLKLSK